MVPVPQLQPMHLRSSISAARELVCAHRTFITASGLVSPLRRSPNAKTGPGCLDGALRLSIQAVHDHVQHVQTLQRIGRSGQTTEKSSYDRRVNSFGVSSLPLLPKGGGGVTMDTAVRPSGCHGRWVPCCPSTSGRPHMHLSSDRARQRQYPPVGRRWHSQQSRAAANMLQPEVASATDSDDPAQPLADGDDALEEPGAACRHACGPANKPLRTLTIRSKKLLLLRRHRRRAARQAGLRIHPNGAPVHQWRAGGRRQ